MLGLSELSQTCICLSGVHNKWTKSHVHNVHLYTLILYLDIWHGSKVP